MRIGRKDLLLFAGEMNMKFSVYEGLIYVYEGQVSMEQNVNSHRLISNRDGTKDKKLT